MDVQRLASTEFRRVYARLTAPVVVTALDRPIGTWVPAATTTDAVAPDSEVASAGEPADLAGVGSPAAPAAAKAVIPKPGRTPAVDLTKRA